MSGFDRVQKLKHELIQALIEEAGRTGQLDIDAMSFAEIGHLRSGVFESGHSGTTRFGYKEIRLQRTVGAWDDTN